MYFKVGNFNVEVKAVDTESKNYFDFNDEDTNDFLIDVCEILDYASEAIEKRNMPRWASEVENICARLYKTVTKEDKPELA